MRLSGIAPRCRRRPCAPPSSGRAATCTEPQRHASPRPPAPVQFKTGPLVRAELPARDGVELPCAAANALAAPLQRARHAPLAAASHRRTSSPAPACLSSSKRVRAAWHRAVGARCWVEHFAASFPRRLQLPNFVLQVILCLSYRIWASCLRPMTKPVSQGALCPLRFYGIPAPIIWCLYIMFWSTEEFYVSRGDCL